MRWPRRGILVRLLIYIPLIAFLGWRAAEGCNGEGPTMAPETAGPDPLAPHRRVITLPDGTQQEIVELTREEAEAILGHPIPEPEKAGGDAPAKAGGAAQAGDAKAGDDAQVGAPAKAGGDAQSGDAKAGAGAD